MTLRQQPYHFHYQYESHYYHYPYQHRHIRSFESNLKKSYPVMNIIFFEHIPVKTLYILIYLIPMNSTLKL